MNRTVDILLVRHPETEANVNGRFVGRGDSPYTKEGRLQFARLRRRIAAFGPDIVWSSPLSRALKPARRAARTLGVALVVDERLVELDFGLAEGMTSEEIAAAGIVFNYRDRCHPVAPQGESRGDIERRAVSFASELVARGGRHAVVTHGGVFRAALAHLLGLRSDDVWAFHVHNAQLAHVKVVDERGMLEEYRQA